MAKTLKEARREKALQRTRPDKKEPSKTKPGPTARQGLSKQGRRVVISIIGVLLGLFLLLSILAPDGTRGNAGPDGATVLWRLLFLMVPLGVMYFLLWGEKLMSLIKFPRRGRKKP